MRTRAEDLSQEVRSHRSTVSYDHASDRQALRRGAPTAAQLLALQRTAGNRAVADLLLPVQTVQRVKDEDAVYEIKKKNEHAFIRELLDGLAYDVFKFPVERSGDGIMGKNTISSGTIYQVPGSKDGLLYHLNFTISAGTMTKTKPAKGGTLDLKLSRLHLTARSPKTQFTIVENGPSILTAAASIHCGPGNDWDWEEPKAKELAAKLGVDVEMLKMSTANSRKGQAYMAAAVPGLKNAIQTTVNGHLPNITVTLLADDSTWT